MVGVSSFVPMFGPAVASLLATISVFTVFLGLAASSIGDSTDLGEGLGLLLFRSWLFAI